MLLTLLPAAPASSSPIAPSSAAHTPLLACAGAPPGTPNLTTPLSMSYSLPPNMIRSHWCLDDYHVGEKLYTGGGFLLIKNPRYFKTSKSVFYQP